MWGIILRLPRARCPLPLPTPAAPRSIRRSALRSALLPYAAACPALSYATLCPALLPSYSVMLCPPCPCHAIGLGSLPCTMLHCNDLIP